MLGVDKIFWINSRNRIDRYNTMRKRIAEYEIPAERFEAILGGELLGSTIEFGEVKRKLNLGEIGCFMSHRAIYELIKKNGWKKTLILEDDALFKETPEVITEKVKRVPEYDMLYFGQWNYDFGNDGKKRALREEIEPGLYRAERCWLTHAYAVDISCIDILLENTQKLYSTIDHVLSDIQENHKLKTYAFYPDLVRQDLSKSSIR